MDAAGKMSALRRLDEQHNRKTALTGLPAMSHVVVTLAFILSVLSVGKYDPVRLVLFFAYPISTLFIGRIPPGMIAARAAFALPLIIFIGAFDPFFDTQPFTLYGIVISSGWLSFLCLLFKCVLTVISVLLLICTIGIDGICSALSLLHVPELIVAQLSFTYRYIHVLGEEVVCLLSAYSLRSPGRSGVSLKQFGPLCGGLFLRSMRHADSIYAAMRCRGFNGSMPYVSKSRFSFAGIFYVLGWSLFFFAARFLDLSFVYFNQ